jgi:hypothetical protein
MLFLRIVEARPVQQLPEERYESIKSWSVGLIVIILISSKGAHFYKGDTSTQNHPDLATLITSGFMDLKGKLQSQAVSPPVTSPTQERPKLKRPDAPPEADYIEVEKTQVANDSFRSLPENVSALMFTLQSKGRL